MALYEKYEQTMTNYTLQLHNEPGKIITLLQKFISSILLRLFRTYNVFLYDIYIYIYIYYAYFIIIITFLHSLFTNDYWIGDKIDY